MFEFAQNSIARIEPITHPELSGVTILPLGGEMPRRGEPQRVLVCIPPNGFIPLHTHRVHAVMDVVAGSARVLSRDRFNGRTVTQGDRVTWIKDSPHGFAAGPAGMSFVSTNDGIVDMGRDWDLTLLDQEDSEHI